MKRYYSSKLVIHYCICVRLACELFITVSNEDAIYRLLWKLTRGSTVNLACATARVKAKKMKIFMAFNREESRLNSSCDRR